MSRRTRSKPSTGWLIVCAQLAWSGCSSETPASAPRTGANLPPPAASAGTGAPTSSGGGGGTSPTFDNPTGQSMDFSQQPMNPEFDDTCASTNVRANRILPTVMLVVDGSTSMQMAYGTPEIPDGGVPDGGMAPAAPSRWSSIRNALVGTNGVVPALQGLVKFGLALFGTQPTCPLPFGIIEPALDNAPAITTALPFAAPGVYTPTGPALDMVVDRLPDSAAVPPDAPPIGPQLIVLATDGDPNSCGAGGFLAQPVTDYAPSIAAALKAQAKHLRMYVVSVGMDAAVSHLQEMANIGAGLAQAANPGAPVYYPEDPQALSDTLAMLIGAELSCDLQLEGKGIRKDLACMGTVTLDNIPLECDGPNGWTLVDETHLKLQGTACDIYKNAANAHLVADFPCQVIIPG